MPIMKHTCCGLRRLFWGPGLFGVLPPGPRFLPLPALRTASDASSDVAGEGAGSTLSTSLGISSPSRLTRPRATPLHPQSHCSGSSHLAQLQANLVPLVATITTNSSPNGIQSLSCIFSTGVTWRYLVAIQCRWECFIGTGKQRGYMSFGTWLKPDWTFRVSRAIPGSIGSGSCNPTVRDWCFCKCQQKWAFFWSENMFYGYFVYRLPRYQPYEYD